MELKELYIVANADKPEALRTLASLKVWCQEHGVEPVPVSDRVPIDVEGGLVLALGGDGTVLRAADLFAETSLPILGVNLGSLGFLTQAPVSELIGALEDILADRFTIEERMRLRYEAGPISGSVLNDLVVTGDRDSRFCELELAWEDGVVTRYPGDGIILATATGSTAYNLAAGGPIVVPPAACILAKPLAPHRLGLRSVIFPPDEEIRLRALSDVILIADGDRVGEGPVGTEIVVTRAEPPTYLVRLSVFPSFFDILERKLNWADSRGRGG